MKFININFGSIFSGDYPTSDTINTVKEDVKSINYSLLDVKIFAFFLLALFFACILIFSQKTEIKPDDYQVKKIASSYHINFSNSIDDVKIISNYSKLGNIVYVLNIKGKTCELTMVNSVRSKWVEQGINCYKKQRDI